MRALRTRGIRKRGRAAGTQETRPHPAEALQQVPVYLEHDMWLLRRGLSLAKRAGISHEDSARVQRAWRPSQVQHLRRGVPVRGESGRAQATKALQDPAERHVRRVSRLPYVGKPIPGPRAET